MDTTLYLTKRVSAESVRDAHDCTVFKCPLKTVSHHTAVFYYVWSQSVCLHSTEGVRKATLFTLIINDKWGS